MNYILITNYSLNSAVYDREDSYSLTINTVQALPCDKTPFSASMGPSIHWGSIFTRLSKRHPIPCSGMYQYASLLLSQFSYLLPQPSSGAIFYGSTEYMYCWDTVISSTGLFSPPELSCFHPCFPCKKSVLSNPNRWRGWAGMGWS